LSGGEPLKDKPLNPLEKVKLSVYKALFKKAESDNGGTTRPTGFASFLKGLFNFDKGWQKIENEFEDLEKRNQDELQKLMDLLKKNPEEGLKYAIPLDAGGTSRGGTEPSGRFELSKRWSNFSLFGNNGMFKGGGGAIDLGNDFYTLQNQYRATAEELIKQKEYEKAAFMYMKLLKEYAKAADTMELGKHYQEAATIHLKHTGNKVKAAQCYEKGNMIQEAIGIYKELNENEKVGDLYMTIDNKAIAMEYYGKVVEQFKEKNQYVKAALLCRNKMFDAGAGQSLLRQGWKKNLDAVNCLNLYFANIPDDDKLHDAVADIYKNDVNDYNSELFLQVMRNEYQRKNNLQETLREMAFEIVAGRIAANPQIAAELKHFNPRNKDLMKDMLRFKLKKER
jgi:hypothetical protein